MKTEKGDSNAEAPGGLRFFSDEQKRTWLLWRERPLFLLGRSLEGEDGTDRFQRRRPWARLSRGDNRPRGHHAAYRFSRRLYRKKDLQNCQVSDCCGQALDWSQTFRQEVRLLWQEYLNLEFRERGDALEVSLFCDNSRLAGPPFNRFEMNLPALKGEGVYGCGEQFSHVNLRGRRVPLWVSEPGVGRHWSDPLWFPAQAFYGAGGSPFTTYFPQTSFITSSGLGCVAETWSYAVFDFATRRGRRRPSFGSRYPAISDSGEYNLSFWGIPRRLVFFQQENLPDLMDALTRHQGRQPALPPWVSRGLWLGLQGGTQVVRRKLAAAESAGIEVGALWCQDWPGKKVTSFGKQVFWNWRYSQELYPGLPEMIQELKKKDIRFLGYINTFLDPEGDLYAEAKAGGHLLMNQQGQEAREVITTFPVPLFDLSRPQTRQWVKEIIRRNMLDIGMDGWMADFGEYAANDAAPHDGTPPEEFHNRYPVEWARVNYEALKEAGKLGESVAFHRSGFTGSGPLTTALWHGDQLVQFNRHDGLGSLIPAALSLGMSGYGNLHGDLGGYTTLAWKKRSRELYFRWTELALFMPILRSHEGNRPEANWQFDSDQETLAFTASMVRVHSALAPYFEALGRDYQEKGLPPWRPVFFYDPSPRFRSSLDCCLCGSDLFLAPVLKPRRRRKRVTLPGGSSWVHLWSGEVHDAGATLTAAAPLGEPPVFYRENSPWAGLFASLKILKRKETI